MLQFLQRALILIAGLALLATPVAAEPALAITHVAIVDVTGGPLQRDMTVIVQDGRITKIGRSAKLRPPKDAHSVDGSGKFLIPGLWDMHTHVVEVAPVYVPVMVANGITGVRNMHAVSMQAVNDLRSQIASGQRLGPRIVANGPLVDGPDSSWPTAVKVATAAEGRKAVADLQAQGADFIKVYSFLPREAYFAIADEARSRGLPFAGHVAQSITVEEASNAGQRSIEHLDGVLRACTRDGDAVTADFIAASKLWRSPATSAEGEARMIAVNGRILALYDPVVAQGLFDTFKRNGTWQTPTLVTAYINAHRGEAAVREAPELRYVYAAQRKAWSGLPAPSAAWTESALATLAANQRLVGALQRAGVGLLAGTDVGGALITPGFSLHQELALMVEAGLTPLQALQAATLNPARYLGLTDQMGTIAAGKAADLVLLDANPLDDIANTRRIRAVVLRGAYLSRGDLDRLLAGAESEAAKGAA
jgi:imidazolonepropionase-like amidohydrolase